MNRDGKKVTVVARALTNPRPQFVSLVSAGANLTPFSVTKSEQAEGEDILTTRTRPQRVTRTPLDNTIAHPLASATLMKSEGTAIAAIAFAKGNVFKAEGHVADWLDAGGYKDYSIEAVDGGKGWAVHNKSETFDGEPRSISVTPDVTVFLGKVAKAEASEPTTEAPVVVTAGEDEGGETVQPVAKTEDTAVVAEAIEGTVDTPAVTDPAATVDAVETKSETPAATDVVVQKDTYEIMDLLSVVRTLTWMGTDRFYNELANNLPVERSVRLKGIAAEALLIISDIAREDANKIIATKSEETPAPVVTTEAPAVEPVAETVAKSEAPAAPVIDVEAILRSAMAPVTEALSQMATAVQTISADVVAHKAETEKRVEAIEQRSQTRKGAGVEDTQATATQTAKVQKSEATRFIDELTLRSAMGR